MNHESHDLMQKNKQTKDLVVFLSINQLFLIIYNFYHVQNINNKAWVITRLRNILIKKYRKSHVTRVYLILNNLRTVTLYYVNSNTNLGEKICKAIKF